MHQAFCCLLIKILIFFECNVHSYSVCLRHLLLPLMPNAIVKNVAWKHCQSAVSCCFYQIGCTWTLIWLNKLITFFFAPRCVRMSMWVCVSRQQSVILRQASALGEIHTDAYVNTSTTAGRLPGRRSPALIWVGFKRYPRIAQLLGKLKLVCCGSYGNWAPTIVVYIKYGIIAL